MLTVCDKVRFPEPRHFLRGCGVAPVSRMRGSQGVVGLRRDRDLQQLSASLLLSCPPGAGAGVSYSMKAMRHKVQGPVAVAKFAVRPQNELGKVVAEGSTNSNLEDGRGVSLSKLQETTWCSVWPRGSVGDPPMPASLPC